MKRSEIHQLIIHRVKTCFSPTEEELKLIEKRLKQFDDTELRHLEKNFTHFGVDAIIECFYEVNYHRP